MARKPPEPWSMSGFAVKPHWDYGTSVVRVRQVANHWKGLTVELAAELRRAHDELSRPGRPWADKTWPGYYREIGVPKSTANGWLLRVSKRNEPVKPHVAQASSENE